MSHNIPAVFDPDSPPCPPRRGGSGLGFSAFDLNPLSSLSAQMYVRICSLTATPHPTPTSSLHLPSSCFPPLPPLFQPSSFPCLSFSFLPYSFLSFLFFSFLFFSFLFFSFLSFLLHSFPFLSITFLSFPFHSIPFHSFPFLFISSHLLLSFLVSSSLCFMPVPYFLTPSRVCLIFTSFPTWCHFGMYSISPSSDTPEGR